MNDNVIFIADRKMPWLSDEEGLIYGEEYKDLWIAVLRTSLDDYWRGIRQGQAARFLSEEPPKFRTRHEAECYRNWYQAGHWLLSDSIEPRSCRWLLKQLGLDHDVVLSRMTNPPARCAETTEED